MSEDDGFGKVLIQSERSRHGASDLCALQAVREARSVVVTLVVDEDLGLVLKAPEGPRVHDPVPIALEGSSIGVGGLRHNAP